MNVFVAALGLLLIFEGMPYFIFPHRMKEFLEEIQGLPDESLRKIGLFAMVLGLIIVFLAR